MRKRRSRGPLAAIAPWYRSSSSAFGAVADGVDDHVQARGVGALDPALQVLAAVDQQPAVLGRVGERLEEGGGVRAERAVDEALERADAQPFVAASVALHLLGEALPGVERNRGVDAGVQPFGRAGAPEDLEIVPRPHVVDAGDAEAGDVRHRRVERAILELWSRRGHRRRHRRHRVVLEHAGEPAAVVGDHRAALDHGNLGSLAGRQAGGLERERVGERHVAVEAVDPHRVPRRRGVDPGAVGELASPALVVPVAARDPGPGLDRRREGADPLGEGLRGGGVAELHRGEPEAALEEVDVGVDEARSDQPFRAIDAHRVGTGEAREVRLGSDRQDPLAADRHRLRPRARGIGGEDARVLDQQGGVALGSALGSALGVAAGSAAAAGGGEEGGCQEDRGCQRARRGGQSGQSRWHGSAAARHRGRSRRGAVGSRGCRSVSECRRAEQGIAIPQPPGTPVAGRHPPAGKNAGRFRPSALGWMQAEFCSASIVAAKHC